MEEYIRTNDNVALWTVRSGKGIPVLLCNGGPGDSDYLKPVAELISDECQVIRFEQRGCGRSEYRGPYELDTIFSDMERIRTYLGHEKWIVGGHSWGADLALAYTLEFPERVLGLIHISGTGIQNDRDWKESYVRAKAECGEAIPKTLYSLNKEVNTHNIISWRKFIKQPYLLKKISNINVPTVFIYGSEDIRPDWSVQQISNLVPNSDFKMIKGASHYVWLTHEHELKNALHSFIEKCN